MAVTVSGSASISPISPTAPAATQRDQPTALLGQAGTPAVLTQSLAMLRQIRQQGRAIDQQDAAWEPPRGGSANGL